MQKIIFGIPKFRQERTSTFRQIAEPVLESGGKIGLAAICAALSLGSVYVGAKFTNDFDSRAAMLIPFVLFGGAASEVGKPAIRKAKWTMNYICASWAPVARKSHFQTLSID